MISLSLYKTSLKWQNKPKSTVDLNLSLPRGILNRIITQINIAAQNTILSNVQTPMFVVDSTLKWANCIPNCHTCNEI